MNSDNLSDNRNVISVQTGITRAYRVFINLRAVINQVGYLVSNRFYALRKNRQTFCLTTVLTVTQNPHSEPKNMGFSKICIMDRPV